VSIYGTVMTATGHIRSFCIITAFAVGINIILNLVLIPRYGAVGCCIAALITQCGCGIAAMWYVKKQLRVNINIRSLIIYILIAAVIGAVLYFGNDLSILPWLSITIAALLAIAIMFTTGLLKITDWRPGKSMRVVD
jgi:O-antigen/teichoic acid export membrane protein